MAGATKPGKQATKGQKQIYEENNSTIRWYTGMAAIAMGFYLVVMLVLDGEKLFTFKYILALGFCAAVNFSSLSLMKWMAKPVFNSSGHVVDGGTDLNMSGGMGENFKDLIIVTSAVQILSLISNYFWYLWLFVPGRLCYIVWTNWLGPWFFAPAPEEQPVDEKKQRKMERKMRRANY